MNDRSEPLSCPHFYNSPEISPFEYIDRATNLVGQTITNLRKNGIDVDLQSIPTDDARTFTVFRESQTDGVLLFETDAARSMLSRLRPDCYRDLTPMVALCRLGPLDQGWDKEFAERKSNGSYYDHPALEPVLRDTYGMILFQEQVVEIGCVVGGFSEADSKAMLQAILKRDWRSIEGFHRKFIDGAQDNGFDRGDGEKIWWILMDVSGYTLSKANAEKYASIAYQMAYLKAHYPAEFAKALDR